MTTTEETRVLSPRECAIEFLRGAPYGGEELASCWDELPIMRRGLHRLTLMALPPSVLDEIDPCDVRPVFEALCSLWADALHLRVDCLQSFRFCDWMHHEFLASLDGRRRLADYLEKFPQATLGASVMAELDYRMAVPAACDAGIDYVIGSWATGVPYWAALAL